MKAGLAGMLVAASVQDSSMSTARVAVIVTLFAVGTVVFVSGPFIAEGSMDHELAWVLWTACAWMLLYGTAIALMSLVAAFWFVVGCAGLALIVAALKGLALLFALAEAAPLASGIGGVGVGVICVAGAVVSAVTGHPRLALTALVAAMWLTGMAASLILENGRYKLRHGRAETVGSCGGCVTGILGLALLVLGPVLALTASGDAFQRVIDGGVIAAFGGSGLWMFMAISRVRSD